MAPILENNEQIHCNLNPMSITWSLKLKLTPMKYLPIVFLILSSTLFSCNKSPKEIPTINIEEALKNKKMLNLSDIATDIEYVSLEFPINMSHKPFNYNNIIVGDKVIVYPVANLERIFVFDRKGKFIHAFNDSDLGDQPKRGGPARGNWDLSPDENHLLIKKWSNFYLFDINGNLIQTCQTPLNSNTFYFLDNDKIAFLRPRSRMKEDGNLIHIYNMNLELTDSLFWAESAGSKPDSAGRLVRIPSDGLYKLHDKIYLKPADNDTLFHIQKDLKIEPILATNFGNFQYPFKWISNKETDDFIKIESMVESDDYMIMELMGPMREDGYDLEYENLIIEKATGQYFTANRLSDDPTIDLYYEDFIDDMDGFGASNYKFFNDKSVHSLTPDYIKNHIETDTITIPCLKTQEYINELLSIAESSNENTAVLRIVHFKSNKKRPKKIKFEPKYPNFNDLDPVVEVRTNHHWIDAEKLSGITYDPIDDSFWLVKMQFRKEDTIEHRSRTGEVLPGGFITDKEVDCEAITVSTIDSSLWLSDAKGYNILHYNRNGEQLDDGFITEGITGIFAMAFDPTDNTLWAQCSEHIIWHYTINGKKLDDEIDVLKLGCEEGRGLTYDIRDNTLWILNSSPHKIIHISKTGELLPGTFYYDPSLVLPDGVALDYENYEFWVGDWGTRFTYK